MCCDQSRTRRRSTRGRGRRRGGAKLLIAHGANLEWTPTKPKTADRARNANVGKTALSGRNQRRQGRGRCPPVRLTRASVSPPFARAVESHTGRCRAPTDLRSGRTSTPSTPMVPRRCTRPSSCATSTRCARSPEGGADLKAKTGRGSPRSSSRRARTYDPAVNPFGPQKVRTAPRRKKWSRCCALRRGAAVESTRPRTTHGAR